MEKIPLKKAVKKNPAARLRRHANQSSERFRTVYSSACCHVVVDGGRGDNGFVGLRFSADLRAACGGFSNDRSQRSIPRRESGCNGLFGNHPPRKAVWTNQRSF